VSEVKADGYVKIPEHKWYQVLDAFTRIDEELEVLIKQVDYSNKLLATIAAALTGQPVSPTPTPTAPTVLVLAKTDTITVTQDAYKEILIPYDLVVITPDIDVLVAKSPDEKGFILYGGAYLSLRRENERVYVKAVSGSANLYISYWQVAQQ
jgi:hypothetical protein